MLAVTNAGRWIGDAWIWRGLSFDVASGERIAVVGSSGSGKTLLLRAVAGLDALDEGRIVYDDRPLTDWSLPAYRARVIYLPQTPAFVAGTVEENLQLAFAFDVHRERHYDRAAVRTHLEALGRSVGFLNREVGVLSGGEQQIVALLRVLQLDPRVLLLDEPTANVDAERTRQIESLLTRWLAARPEAALVWTSHDAAQIERMTTRRIDLGAYAVAGADAPVAVDPQ